jgi:hypothetical protein
LKTHGQLVDVDVLAIQDRLERSLGRESYLQDALMKVEENVASDAGTVLVRMTEFYGLSREDWLSLVIKVSPRTSQVLMIVLLCPDGETRE